ncbi:MAG TPA: 3-dehydroquinate synthase [Ruminococcus sp.]|jgi:3-dehydroquinate synthase|nr:3-dehydroquinate synthase [Ruminococcus sp.]
MVLTISPGGKEYDVTVEAGCLNRASELFDLGRKCLVVTDDGVPGKYAEKIVAQCKEPVLVTLHQGEESKSMKNLEKLLTVMLNHSFTRGDCAVAVGGGMPGDLAGFTAATYMRGIDFYNVPTTLLSQADSSIGGKTAVDLGGVKNIVGAFHQPSGVLIDTDTLETLSARQRAAGLAEIIKSGLIADADLFSYIEENIAGGLDMGRIIEEALQVKKKVVEEDERESGLRRILNFGHTIGHGIESVTGLLHGECVATGMIPMCSPEVRERLVPVLESAGLPVQAECDPEAVFEAVTHDKKAAGGIIKTVYVPEPGKAEIIEMGPEDLRIRINSICHI